MFPTLKLPIFASEKLYRALISTLSTKSTAYIGRTVLMVIANLRMRTQDQQSEYQHNTKRHKQQMEELSRIVYRV